MAAVLHLRVPLTPVLLPARSCGRLFTIRNSCKLRSVLCTLLVAPKQSHTATTRTLSMMMQKPLHPPAATCSSLLGVSHGNIIHKCVYSTSSIASSDLTDRGELVYTAPLAGAVKAVKGFSLTTALLAAIGSPILIFYGNPSMSLAGRVLVTSFVTLLGVSTTLILHWFIKTYVTKLYFNRSNGMVSVERYSMFLRKRVSEFHISQAGPPSSVTSFSTFQANGVGYFLHSEVFDDRQLLSQLVGSYSVFESKVE